MQKMKKSWTGNVKQNPAYKCFTNAKQRCTNPNSISYKNYGGRGIKFLYTSFEEFLNDVGPRPSMSHTLERINNNGHYEIGNVVWATWDVQVKSRRKRQTAFGINGVHRKSGRDSFIAYSNKEALYIGKDFFESCCVRKSWEQKEL